MAKKNVKTTFFKLLERCIWILQAILLTQKKTRLKIRKLVKKHFKDLLGLS